MRKPILVDPWVDSFQTYSVDSKSSENLWSFFVIVEDFWKIKFDVIVFYVERRTKRRMNDREFCTFRPKIVTDYIDVSQLGPGFGRRSNFDKIFRLRYLGA